MNFKEEDGVKRTTGQILGQTSKGETTRLNSCRKCCKCGRHYRKNWMQVYWKPGEVNTPNGKEYYCPYCDMDKRGLSLREGIKDVHMMMWNSLGQDPKAILRGYRSFGSMDIDKIPDDYLEKIVDLQIQNQELVKKLAQTGIPNK